MKKRLIAIDTGEPLTVLGGYEVEEGGGIRKHYVEGAPNKPQPTREDFELLKQHGEQGLRDKGFYGVSDRLGLLKEGELG